MPRETKISAAILGVLAVIAAITFFSFKYAWGADLKVDALEPRVVKVETLVDVQKEDINDLVKEQRAMRTDFNTEQRATRATIHEMWKDLKETR